ncbi:MAG: SDR family oxidoreductase [Planctomycetaceae bacterium]|nr:SDR family oxidoreductase [Planctomycetaceae bacterium]
MIQRFSLHGRTALITGGTRGIGLAIARGFLDAGAHVVISSRRQENVDEALRQLDADDSSLLGVAAHVGEPQDIEHLVDAAQESFGTVTILVNNAGTNPYFGPMIESDDRAWDKTMDVNLKGPYMLSRLVARRMIAAESGGSIINIASVAGLTASPLQGLYSVSKAGLIMLTRVMARELGRSQIRVNCICPGVIKTKLSEALWKDPQAEQHHASQKALGRVGETEELIGAALYFASDASSFTTGAVLQVDGGMVI